MWSGTWPGPLDHDLHAALARPRGEFAQGLQLLELRRVRGVGQAAGPEPVAQAQAHVVLARHVQDLVVAGEERVLLVMVEHPLDEEAPAAGDHAHDPRPEQGHARPGHAAVHGDEVHPVLYMRADRVEKVVLRQAGHVRAAHDRLVHGHGADRNLSTPSGWSAAWRGYRRPWRGP